MVKVPSGLMVAAALLLAVPAAGDWVPQDGHKMHFPQQPDLYPTGMDVYDVAPMRLADDFQCSRTGPICGVHVWTSWKNDVEGVVTGADLAIRSDAGTVPGGLLWSRSFAAAEIQSQSGAVNLQEDWYNPATGEYLSPGDTACYLLNFFIAPEQAFEQTQGEHYWLDVTFQLDPQATEEVGWKTTRDNYGDGAVWWDADAGAWQRLEYPGGHDWQDDPADLAFVITPEPAGLVLLAAGAAAMLRRRRR